MPALAAGLLALFPGAVLQAQDADDAELERIEVRAEQAYRTGDVFPDDHAGVHAHITREELDTGALSLAAVIARQSGVQSRQSGGFGSFASVSIRAAGASRTDVYLDGVLLNSAGFPVVDLSTLEMLNLGSVDLYRGSTPMQLGHGAIGGAVNLNTRQAEAAPTTRLRIGVGSLSRRELQLTHQGQHGAWDWTGAIAHRHSDNDFSFVNDNTTPLNPADDRRERRHNAEATRNSALLRSGYQHDADTRIDLTLQLAVRELGVPEYRNARDNEAAYDTESEQWQLSLLRDNIGAWQSRHTLYRHGQRAHYRDRLSQVGLGAQDNHARTRTTGLRSYWEYPAHNGTLGLSAGWRHESHDHRDTIDSSSTFSARRDRAQASLHYSWFDERERWSVTPALRWQHDHLQDTLPASGVARNDSTTTHTGLQIGVAWRPAPTWVLSANLGNYYREPSFGELYGSSGLINGNPDLDAERGTNADIGIRRELRHWQLGANVFVSERDELIVTSYDSRGIGRNVNTGKADVSGVEIDTTISLSEQMAIIGHLTWQSSRSRDPEAGFHGRQLPGEAEWLLSARLRYRPDHWSYWYEIDSQRNRFYDRANILPAEDSTRHSIGIDWQRSGWQLSLVIDNLGDDTIEDFNGFPRPGRTAFLSLTHTFNQAATQRHHHETTP